MKHFKFYGKKDILSLTRVRQYETKLGERISTLHSEGEWPEVMQESSATYVIIGIPEDIGVKANEGVGGADTSWHPFLDAFLNLQSNDYFSGENVLLLGHFDFGDLKYLIENNADNPSEKRDAYRHAVSLIDAEVEDIIKAVTAAGKIPIVIGGGHNNAYPIIKGSAKGLYKRGTLNLAQLNCINLDAHSDYRPMEGRHSGNAFRYAEADGYLGKYAVVGLHESYVSQNVLQEMQDSPFISFSTYEDIFLLEKINFIQAVAHATGFTEDSHTGIELDVDAISGVLSSALTPVGISALQAQQYLHFVATDSKTAYLHICEGACRLGDGTRSESTGKLLSYLVSTFLKAKYDL